MKSLKPLGSRIISVEEARRIVEGLPDVKNTPPQVEDTIEVRALIPRNSYGTALHHYSRVLLNKVVFKDVRLSVDNAQKYCKEHGYFLPDFALLCNVYKALYEDKRHDDLSQLFDTDDVYLTNTSIGWGLITSIYHSDSSLPFNRHKGNYKLEGGYINNSHFLSNEVNIEFLRQLTGLQEPLILTSADKLFHRPAYIDLLNHAPMQKTLVTLGGASDQMRISVSNHKEGLYTFLGVKHG